MFKTLWLDHGVVEAGGTGNVARSTRYAHCLFESMQGIARFQTTIYCMQNQSKKADFLPKVKKSSSKMEIRKFKVL